MKLSLRKKVLGLTFISVVSIATVISAISIINILSRGEGRIRAYRTTLMSERQQLIKGYVEMTIRMVEKLPADEAKRVVRTMRYGQHGYVWINDFNNIMIVHPDPRLEGKDQSDLRDPKGVYILREITRLCREKGQGYLEYMWKMPGQEELKPKLSYAAVIPGTKWIAGTGIYIDDIDVQVARERANIRHEVKVTVAQSLVLSLIVTIALLILAVYLVNRYITGPVEAISRAVKDFNSNLSTTVPVTTDDEVGTLACWLNEHFSRLRQILGLVSDVTARLHGHAGTIASTIDRQSGFATQLSSSVVEISSTMEEFSSTASQIAQHSQGVVERADKTLDDTKNGAAEVENLTFKVNDISQNIQDNLAEIVELGRKSKEINKVMEIINNIANQTKLIAFNAALEAASAGEAGKRFGVVAVEIRRLADSVVESTTEIEGKITEILNSVDRLVMSSEKSSQLLQEGQEYASHTVAMLIESVDGVEETASAARQISLSTQQQQIASNQVVLALKDIEQGVRYATDSILESNVVSTELAALSEQLQSLIKTFNIGTATTVHQSEAGPEHA